MKRSKGVFSTNRQRWRLCGKIDVRMCGDLEKSVFGLPPLAARVRLPKLLSGLLPHARADSHMIPAALLHIHLSLHRPLGERRASRRKTPAATTSKHGSFAQFAFSCQTPFITLTCFTATRCLFFSLSLLKTESVASRHAGQTDCPLRGSTGAE